MWPTHKSWLTLIAVLINGLWLCNAFAAELHGIDEIDWLDIAGEGSMSATILLWLGLIVASRPSGKVTNFLVAGLALLFMATLQDFLDEVFVLGHGPIWHKALENLPLPLGMVFLTIGLFYLRREQLVIRRQLTKREKLFRAHEQIDPVIHVANLDYLKQHLELSLKQRETEGRPFSLLLLDLHNFHHLNTRYGPTEGDHVLHSVAEMLILNLRRQDLLCRYAGDRYAIILADTRAYEAQRIAQELEAAISHFAYRSEHGERLYLSASSGLAYPHQDSAQSLLQTATQNLLQNKTKFNQHSAAA